MGERKYEEFLRKLESQHEWPSLYMFKFIVPAGKEDGIRKLFPMNEVVEKPSKEGKYVSLTIQVMINSSDEVVRIYEEAHKIEGVIAL